MPIKLNLYPLYQCTDGTEWTSIDAASGHERLYQIELLIKENNCTDEEAHILMHFFDANWSKIRDIQAMHADNVRRTKAEWTEFRENQS